MNRQSVLTVRAGLLLLSSACICSTDAFTPQYHVLGTHINHSPILSKSVSRTRLFGSKFVDDDEILGPLASGVEKNEATEEGKATTRTVNERLMAELEEIKQKEKYGAKSSLGKKIGLDSFASSKSDAEKQAAIEEARDLNGVNPLVALGGSAFALLMAAGLWALTGFLAEVFATHPMNSDVYFVQRTASVFRNVIMGLSSLASGFFGVCGLGVFLLGVRVAYGVAKGELDPTPIKSKKQEVEMPNVWDLMMNKKPGRRN
jgi:hypothetical protein